MANKGAIKIGIVGCGRAGLMMHWGEIKPRCRKFRVIAAYDFLKERRDKMAEETGCTTYAKFEDLINDPEVELVDIASNTLDHVPQAIAALKVGKNVFLEKPIAKDFREASKLMRAVEKSSGKLYVRHNRRFEPAFQHIHEIIDSGLLGNVYAIKLNRGGYQRRCDWQTLKECAGGQLLNWGPHLIDHALQFLDGSVDELWSDLKRIAAAGDAEDHVRIILKGSSGRIVEVEITGGAALPQPVYYVAGSKGTLICENEQTIQLKYLDPKHKLSRLRASKKPPKFNTAEEKLKWVEKTIRVSPKLKVATASIWDYLYDAIRNGKEFPITNSQALAVMKIIDNIKRGTKFYK